MSDKPIDPVGNMGLLRTSIQTAIRAFGCGLSDEVYEWVADLAVAIEEERMQQLCNAEDAEEES